MGAARESVADENGIRSFAVERAVCLIGNVNRGQKNTRLELVWMGFVKKPDGACPDMPIRCRLHFLSRNR
jgi:hypothetical protein